MAATREDVVKALAGVIDPASGKDVVSAGLVQGLTLRDGNVGFAIEVPAARGPQSEPLRKAAEDAVAKLPGVFSVTAVLTPAINPFSLLTLDHFSAILTNPLYTGAIGNSLLIATVGAAIATACIAVIALVAHRSTFRFRGSLEHIVLYPRAVPGIITGMAFFWTFAILDQSGTFRATLWAVGIAFGVRALAMGYAAFYPSLAALGEDLDRAARSAGADWWTAMRTIIIRLLRPAMGILSRG